MNVLICHCPFLVFSLSKLFVKYFMLMVNWHRCSVCCFSVDRHLKHRSAISSRKPRCWRHMVLIHIHARFFKHCRFFLDHKHFIKQFCPTWASRLMAHAMHAKPPVSLVTCYSYQMCAFNLYFKLFSYRMCLGTLLSSPSHHSVLWCFRETGGFIFSSGEPNCATLSECCV